MLRNGPDPDQRTALRNTRYLGSHPDAVGQADNVDVIFTDRVIRFRQRREVVVELEWREIKEIDAGDDESVRFDRRQQQTLSYLVIVDGYGRWVFEVPGLSKMELRSGLMPLRRFIPPQDAPREVSTRPADRLAHLQEMLDRGLITDAEFAAKRAQLLDEL